MRTVEEALKYQANLCAANEQAIQEELNQLERAIAKLGLRADLSNPKSEAYKRDRAEWLRIRQEIGRELAELFQLIASRR